MFSICSTSLCRWGRVVGGLFVFLGQLAGGRFLFMQERRGATTRRILVLIDMMATYRRPHPVKVLTDELNERLGERYCQRTVRRDLDVLQEQGLVIQSKKRNKYLWKLVRHRSEAHQKAAIEINP